MNATDSLLPGNTSASGTPHVLDSCECTIYHFPRQFIRLGITRRTDPYDWVVCARHKGRPHVRNVPMAFDCIAPDEEQHLVANARDMPNAFVEVEVDLAQLTRKLHASRLSRVEISRKGAKCLEINLYSALIRVDTFYTCVNEAVRLPEGCRLARIKLRLATDLLDRC